MLEPVACKEGGHSKLLLDREVRVDSVRLVVEQEQKQEQKEHLGAVA